ncbi:MAG: acyl carrier protein [Thiohalomonadaceae bacterium]
MSVESSVRQFLLSNYLFTDSEDALGNDDSLLQKGIVDSTGMMELIYFLEEQFGIRVRDEEMIPENLDSVNNIVGFIARKSAERGSQAAG